MAIFEVTGGKKLSGSLFPQGAKNEALQVICAVLLTDQEVTISNIPHIADVLKLIELLADMGVEVQPANEHTYRFCAKKVNIDYLISDEFKKKGGSLRGSIMLMGPLLARFRKAYMTRPGGDKIGRRRIDTHIFGFKKLGARFEYDESLNLFKVVCPRLKGTYMLLDEASVTGTANIIMASVLAEGTTVIFNAACEPYIQQLCKMLCRMGAKISGIGSNLLTIEGVSQLNGTTHTLLSDMIEVGSFIGLAALTQSDITIKNAGVPHLGIIPEIFSRLGIKMEIQGDDIRIPPQDVYEIESFLDGSVMTISDAPWPGFTPDLISIVLVTAIQARGNVLIHQKMFESRLFFVDKLIDMGAQIILCDPHRAVVMGLARKHPLKGIQMASPDIRAGVALLIAALSARGKSIIFNVGQIDRGYQFIDTRLNALGAEIIRKDKI
jgi:UDP-N-acetylglucosamine 1-carboxyvinyltransferase